MLSQSRRQEILDRIQKEREDRSQRLLDESLIQTPQIGYLSSSTVTENISDAPSEAPSRQRLKEMKENLFKKRKQLSPCGPDLDRLAKPKTEIIAYREAMKQQKEESDFKALTFHPEISEESNQLAAQRYSQYQGVPIQDRLYDLEKQRQEHLEALKLLSVDEEHISLPPRPHSEQEPLYKRYNKVLVEKEAMLECLKLKQMQKEIDLFHPKISAKSEMIAQIVNDGRTLLDRLMDPIPLPQQSEISYDFIPATNKQYNSAIQATFEERQLEFRQRQMDKSMKREEENSCTFAPSICKMSEKLVPQYDEEVYNRLYAKHAEKQQLIMKLQNQEGNFYPELCERSMKMAQDRTLDDLINDDRSQKLQILKEKYNDRDNECSFYPSVSTASRFSQMHSQYSFTDCSDKIKEYQEKKEQNRINKQKELEKEEMEKCTFKPMMYKRVSVAESNVKGMEEYMMQRDLARRQKDQKASVEQRLFERHQQYDPKKHSRETKQEPFRLTETKSKSSYKKN